METMYLIIAIVIALLLEFGIWLNTRKEYPVSWKWLVGVMIFTVLLFPLLKVNYDMLFQRPAVLVFIPFVANLLMIGIIDWKHQLIPNRLSAFAFVLSGIYCLSLWSAFGKELILGGIVLLGIFVLLYVFAKGAFGMGDVKLSPSIGLMIGLSSVGEFMMFTMICAAFLSLILIACKLKNRKDKIAFGPFMVVGFLILWMF